MTQKQNFTLGFLVFAIFYLCFSFLTYKDYGITADEETEYNSGKALATYYLTGNSQPITGLPERHLPINSTYLRIYPAVLSLLNFTGYYEWFHLLNLIFGLAIFLVFYTLVYLRYKNSLFSLLGACALFFTPRILGHMPVNPKDIPFATLYLSSLGLIYFIGTRKKPPLLQYIVLSLVFGLSWGLRIVGLSLFLVFLLYNFLSNRTQKPIKLLFITMAIFLGSLVPLFAIWPYFRINFPEVIPVLVQNASDFGHWDRKMLFMGKFLSKDHRPFFYLPVWMLITTPLFILIPFLISPLMHKKTGHPLYLLCFVAVAINLFLYFVTKPIVYNGLRHFLYLLPIVSLTAFMTIKDLHSYLLLRNRILSAFFLILVASGVTSVGYEMIKLHPYEYLYFNQLVGGLKGASGKFEMDYWFASNKEASDWLASNITESSLPNVYPCNLAFSVRYYSQAKFELTNKVSQADYIICDFETDYLNNYSFPIIKTVERDDVPVNIVRKTR